MTAEAVAQIREARAEYERESRSSFWKWVATWKYRQVLDAAASLEAEVERLTGDLFLSEKLVAMTNEAGRELRAENERQRAEIEDERRAMRRDTARLRAVVEAYSAFDDVIDALSDARREQHQHLIGAIAQYGNAGGRMPLAKLTEGEA